MSRKNKHLAELNGLARASGGSHLTLEARLRYTRRFSNVLFQMGFTHIDRLALVLAKHIQRYFHQRLTEGISVRTLQNEASHLRVLLRADGRAAHFGDRDRSFRSIVTG